MSKNYISLVFLFLFYFNSITAQTVVNIPDPNFEQALIDLGIDSDETLNGKILYYDAYSVSSLDVSNKNISDLSGLGSFENLTYLDLSNNNFDRLELDMPNLVSLNIDNNPLVFLTIRNSNLSNLNISTNTKLKQLLLYNNPLTSIDLSQNIDLELIDIMNSPINSIDISQNPNLLFFSSINNSELTYVDLRNGNNNLLTRLDVVNSPLLTCIYVDNAIAANAGQAPYTEWRKDNIATYRTESCDYDIALSVDKTTLLENGEQATITATLNEFNPTEDVTINLTVSGTAAITNYTLSSNTIIIPSGQLTASVTITANEDEMDSDKTVIIDVESVEQADELTEQQLIFTIKHINDAPTDITLNPMSFEENNIINEISTITVTDIDDASHTITLVDGNGSDDNSFFSISGNTLSKNVVFDYEAKKEYFIRVKAEDAEGLFIEKALIVSVINLNDIVITGDASYTYCGNDEIGSIQTSIEQYVPPLSFSWSSGETTQNITNKTSGIYTLTVTDGAGMVLAKDFEIETRPIYNNLNICYVTSDNVDSDYNRIFINNKDAYNIDKVQILREGSVSNEYEIIGEINPDEESYLDTTSDNRTVSYNYKVRFKDKCGNLSESSPLHQTILLQANRAADGSINLNWSEYAGLTYSTYNIYRKENNNEFELITSLSSNNLAYNDKDANSNTISYTYFIGINLSNPCDFTISNKRSKSFITNNLIKSNFKSFDSTLSDNEALIEKTNSIYPNPTNGLLYIKGNIFKIRSIDVYSTFGQKVLQIKDNFREIDLSNLQSALYLIKVNTDQSTTTYRVIKK
ncbi:T9SS type A sorting domain-containing protein [Gelatiniphilus marinus]|uniref:T9SS type A sorting domain-containing protein n=1 Tax=Gelatiniphilus marinus TaxID=1759464 RepID=A0ABW5JSG5_9FLAO